jgi:cell division protein FtsB
MVFSILELFQLYIIFWGSPFSFLKNSLWRTRWMSGTKDELKEQLSVLTARRDRMQKNLYEVEKEIAEITNMLAKLK